MSYKAKINKLFVQCDEIQNGVVRLKHLQGADMNLNETGKLVFKWLEETDSVDEISQRLIDHYSMDLSKLEGVQKDTMNLLNKAWRIGAIKWNGEIPNEEERVIETSNGSFERLTIEKDKEIYKLLDKFYLDAHLAAESEKDYINIGICMISRVTNYDIYTNIQTGQKTYLMSQFDHHTNQLNLKGIYSDGEINLSDLDELLTCGLKLSIVNPKYIQKKQKQIPVFMNVFTETGGHDLERMGFNSKGILRKEINMKDVDFLVKDIDCQIL